MNLRPKYLMWYLLFTLLVCLLIYYSTRPNKAQATFTNLTKDTCVYLKKENGEPLMISRYVKVVKNTFRDTTAFGGGILRPGETGKRADRLFTNSYGILTTYYEEESIEANKIDKICVNLYKDRPVKGELIIEYYYE